MRKIQKITIIKYTEYKCTLYKQVERVQNKILFQQYVAKKSSKAAKMKENCGMGSLWMLQTVFVNMALIEVIVGKMVRYTDVIIYW